jgi:hypothetical protein
VPRQLVLGGFESGLITTALKSELRFVPVKRKTRLVFFSKAVSDWLRIEFQIEFLLGQKYHKHLEYALQNYYKSLHNSELK